MAVNHRPEPAPGDGEAVVTSKRILFVDDEPDILDGLRHLQFDHADWDVVFALGGAAALTELENGSFDAVVTDMRMPGVDGATLLQKVRERQPRAARIVLAGHTEREAALRALPLAQQFLGKPLDAAAVGAVLARTFRLQEVVEDPSIRDVVGKIQSLPSVPSLYYELTQVLASPETSMADIAAVAERDQAMTAKLLQIVNSVYFGFNHEITSIKDSITYLGVDMLKGLVLSAHVFRAVSAKTARILDLDRFQRQAFLSARVARRLLRGQKSAPEAFTAALLRDIGQIVLAQHLTGRHASVQEAAQETGRPLHVVEREMLGVTHAQIGAYLLGLWGLPHTLVEAAAFHHDVQAVQGPGCEVLAAVHVADVLVERSVARPPAATAPASDGADGADSAATNDAPVAADGIDLAFLERAGVADLLPTWQMLAEAELLQAKESC